MGVSRTSSSPIFCDNRSMIKITHNDVFHECTKHIEIDCHFVHHHLLHGTLCLYPIASTDQLTDVFTKHIRLDGFMILFLNSSWHLHYHLKFEGEC
jgi:hypothetical protein